MSVQLIAKLTVHNGVGEDGGHSGLLGKELDGVQQTCGVHPVAGRGLAGRIQLGVDVYGRGLQGLSLH